MSMGLDPMTQTVLGLALQAGGTMLRRQEEEDVRQRQMNRQNQEADAQAQIAAQNANRARMAAQQVTQQQSAPQIEQDAAKIQQQITPAAAGFDTGNYAASNPGAPKEVSDAMAAAVGKAIAQGKAYAGTKSKLSAYNNSGVNANIALGQSGTDIGLNNNRAQGSWNVMGQDLNAIRPDQNMMALSDIGSGVGGLFATNGLRGVAFASRPSTSPRRVPIFISANCGAMSVPVRVPSAATRGM